VSISKNAKSKKYLLKKLEAYKGSVDIEKIININNHWMQKEVAIPPIKERRNKIPKLFYLFIQYTEKIIRMIPLEYVQQLSCCLDQPFSQI